MIGLQASRVDGEDISTDDFLTPLNIHSGETEAVRADSGVGASGMVYLAVIWYSDYVDVDTTEDAGAQSEAFIAGTIDGFRKAGCFFDRRLPEVTAGLRASGLSLRVFVDVRMDDDQMELEFPPEFLAACGRHGLGKSARAMSSARI